MAPWISTPSKPAASAFAAPRLKLSMMPGISSSVRARGSEISTNAPPTNVLPLARIADGRDRQLVVLLQADMRDASDMPELDEDAAAALMHAIGDLAPARHLLLRVDAGGVLIALALLRNLARLGHQQAGGGALPVIFDRQRARHQACDRAVARQGRHHQAVGQGDRAKLVGLEEFGRLCHVGLPESCRSGESGHRRHAWQCREPFEYRGACKYRRACRRDARDMPVSRKRMRVAVG